MNQVMKNKIETYINLFFQPVASSVRYAIDYNMPIQFDSGSFGEGLICISQNTKGSGTQGGASFDTSAGDEVKTLFFFQSKECTKEGCKYKNSFFTKNCNKCGHTGFKYAKDTRAGIACDSHFDYFKDLRNYYIIEIKPTSYDPSCREAKIIGWIIKKDNTFFNSLLKVQKNNGTCHKNLLTSSVEFKMCAPSKFLEAKVDFSDSVKSNVVLLNEDYNTNTVEHIKEDLWKRQYRKWRPHAGQNYDPVINKLEIVAISGTHGKKRGNVVRKNKLRRTS